MKLLIWVATVVIGAGVVLAQRPPDIPNKPNPPFFGGKDKKDEDADMRSVEGVVRLPNDSPAEGAVVQLKDTKTLQVRSYITKEDGNYRFYGLRSNTDYQVKADRQGESSGTKTISVFDSRKQVVINLKLEPKK